MMKLCVLGNIILIIKKVMLETRRRKRAYEMLPVVMDYKSKEVALQNLIDEVVSKIAFSVSKM